MLPPNVALLYAIVTLSVPHAHGFALPVTTGAATGASRITPVSNPTHDNLSVDVVIRMPFGTFLIGFPIVIPSKYMKT